MLIYVVILICLYLCKYQLVLLREYLVAMKTLLIGVEYVIVFYIYISSCGIMLYPK